MRMHKNSDLHSCDACHCNFVHCFDLVTPVQTPEHLKSRIGEEAFNPDGLVQRSIKLLKDDFPDIEVSFAFHNCRHI